MHFNLEVPSHAAATPFVGDFLCSYLTKFELMGLERQKVENDFKEILSIVGKNPMTLDFWEGDKEVTISILNKGIPLFQETLQGVLKNKGHIFFDNLGRLGQRINFKIRLSGGSKRKDASDICMVETPKLEEIEVRLLKEGEETKLSQLFYQVYGYQYINEYVYYPEKLKSMREEGKLVSVIADFRGKLISHVGLVRLNDTPSVYEAALGVSDPLIKSKGIFRKVFQTLMERVKTVPMLYCVFDCVTNHDFTQKLVSSYGACDLSLFVGCQTNRTQARLEKLGIGKDPKEMDRYTLLYSVLSCVRQPFGSEVVLPDNLGEMLGFLLEPLHLSWVPAPRFSLLAEEGAYMVKDQPEQSSVYFDLWSPGRRALQDVLNHWSVLLRNGYQYAAVDIPLNCSGMAMAHDLLASHGFFISGLLPYHFGDTLACRFQAIGPTKVAFNEIQAFSPTTKRLLEIIQKDYERNKLL